MRTLATSILLAAAVGLASSAFAASPAPASGQSGAPAASSPTGCQMGCGMMGGSGACVAASDEGLTAVKAQLDLTPEQLPLWNAVADAAKANAQALPQGMGMMQNSAGGQGGQGMMMGGGALPDRLARAETMMTAQLDALRRFRTAVTPFYASLTPAQKATADKLLCSPMGGARRP